MTIWLTFIKVLDSMLCTHTFIILTYVVAHIRTASVLMTGHDIVYLCETNWARVIKLFSCSTQSRA